MADVLCIGIGNRFRRDDSVGLCVAARLRARNLPGVCVIEGDSDGAVFMDAWRDANVNTVILIDAASSGAEPGTLFQFAAHAHPLPANYFAYSSHAFGVAEAIELARLLGELPDHCIVFGVEGADFGFGCELSPKVERAAQHIVPVIVRTIEALQNAV